ncbi:Adaptin ear-binding coat-associated protein 1 [Lachnellula cervina]|uniref:Adaptin ear-binding coat-associated protein 1 n=1 Tax=Lachnellula cervina TaxID=1316786 RepID=A0A7D8YU41_9HELO|nr:Adaptin ear-binding coat-associated protein 1 [Lachnellula cervina]
MESIDPSTGRPLPADAIQRILFIAPSVHHQRLRGRLVDRRRQQAPDLHRTTTHPRDCVPTPNNEESVKTDILLEDPSNGQLFAASPYTAAGVVEQVLDSSRFFAVRVEGEGGRKAMLGVGFEERSEAFDFSVALQEVRKTLGFDDNGKAGGKKVSKEKEKAPEKKDFSLKEGETITVNIGGRGRRNQNKADELSGDLGAFSLPPPPGGSSLLPPPPSAQAVRRQKRLSQSIELPKPGSIEDLGFDDGEFGEFQ